VKLWKNPRDGYFHIRHGQRRKSLGTKDPDFAQKLYREFEKLSLEEQLASIEGASRVTLSEFRDRYIGARGGRAKDTLRADRFAFSKLIWFAGDRLLSSVSREDIAQFLSALSGEGLKPNSVSSIGRHLRAAFNEAIEWGILKENPFRKIKLRRLPGRAPRLVVGKVRAALLFACDGLAKEEPRFRGFRPVIEFLLATGLRRIELVRLKWKDVLEAEIHVHGKGDKHRSVPITPSSRTLLGSTGKPDAYIFPRWRDPNTITRMFKEVARKAKIPDVTPHTLRHTTESQLAMQGVDLQGRMAMLGHSTVEMALHYTHVTAEQLRDALGRIEREDRKKARKFKAG
jgi:site-specific recombinase XerD